MPFLFDFDEMVHFKWPIFTIREQIVSLLCHFQFYQYRYINMRYFQNLSLMFFHSPFLDGSLSLHIRKFSNTYKNERSKSLLAKLFITFRSVHEIVLLKCKLLVREVFMCSVRANRLLFESYV